MTASIIIAAVCCTIVAAVAGWQVVRIKRMPAPRHDAASAPQRPPAPRDWGESRLPGVGERTGQLEAITGAVPWADVDQFLTEDAKRWPAEFDKAYPVLAGEALPATEPPLPDPGAEYLPARVIGDVPTGLIEFQGEVSPELLASFREAFSIPAPDETSVDGMRPVPAGISDREFVRKVRRSLADERAALASFIAEVDHAVLSEADALVETTLAALEHGLAVARG